MDFGKIDNISDVDFALPPSHPSTSVVLGAQLHKTPNQKPQVFVGCPVWSNKNWVGKIYPSVAKEKDFLYHYTRQFNTIELNVTHYQSPSPDTIAKWKTAATDRFTFCPKFPQAISHDSQLSGVENQTLQFCEAVLALGTNLGTTFLQLAPYFDHKKLPILASFLKSLPKQLPVAVEFRNPVWFSDAGLWRETIEILQSHNVGTVITDVAGRRDVLHQTLTTPTLALRFVGNQLHRTDYTRADEWVQRIRVWLGQGLQTAYIFVHCGNNDQAPELVKYWVQQLNIHCGLHLDEPRFLPRAVQGSLF